MTNNTDNLDNRTLLQQMAAKKREEMRMNDLYGNKANSSNTIAEEDRFKNNSFWAFQEDSDDDNENMNANDGSTQSMGGTGGTATRKKKKLASPFQFAAPSFVVPNHSNDNGVQVDSSAVDPNL